MAVQFRAQAEPIPGYKLIEPLGKGGFGEVWKCAAPGGVLKAIKLVHGSLRSGHGEEVLVQQELKALTCVRGVRHPYILSIDRFDIIDGQLMIVTELADQSLWDKFTSYTSQGKAGIPREELLRYMEETAEALDLMNIQYRLQHSDIKPQNLFLIHNHVKVADFGLVKDLSGMKAMTSGCFSPLYSAPETFEGWLSEQSDQYSLGIVFQELLTGQRPFDGKNARQLLMQHMQAEPNLASLQSAADREIIAKSLRKKPGERFSSCGELVRALRQSGQPAAVVAAAPAAAPAPPAGPLANAPSIVEAMQAANQSGAAYHLTFAIRCSKCGYTGRVPKKAQGKTVKCRQCDTLFTAQPIAEGRPAPSPPPAPRAPAPATLLLPPSSALLPPSSSIKQTPTRVQDTQRMPPVAKPNNPPPSILPPVQPQQQSVAAAPAPAAAPPEPAVECPVCGHLKHGPVENQPGRLKCLRCGCVHGARAEESPAPALSAVKPAAAPTKPSSAKTTPTVECPVCGTRGFLPNPFLGGTVRCHQCGCVHRV